LLILRFSFVDDIKTPFTAYYLVTFLRIFVDLFDTRTNLHEV